MKEDITRSKEFVIRKANRIDSRGFLDLLVALANFEHLEPPSTEGRKRIVNDIFSKKRLNLLVAEEYSSRNKKGKLVGYALYFYTYSSFLARPTFYLEDIFVLEDYRGKGVGRELFRRCVNEASKENCGRMEWSVLTWNKKAIRFYEKLGARRLSEWYFYRLTSEGIAQLASKF